MSTATAITTSGYNQLQVQESSAAYQQQAQALSNYAWQVAYTALWNARNFSSKEIENAKAYISDFLQQGTSHYRQYREFVQRVLLARLHVSSHPGKYIPRPAKWLSTENSNGFAGTANWYKAVQHTRESRPSYKQCLKDFPEAIRDTIQSGKAIRFHYWRSYFIQQKANGLLNLYLATIANYYLSME